MEYSVSVRGCDFTAVDSGRLLGCSQWSSENLLRTKSKPAGTFSASTITASPSMVAPRSTVKIDGVTFLPGTVDINISGAFGFEKLTQVVPQGGLFNNRDNPGGHAARQLQAEYLRPE
jgi:hypothetical protein